MSKEIIDRNFIINATNPSNGKSYTELDSLLICAHDKAAPFALLAYRTACINLGCSEESIKSIELLIERVKRYQKENGSKIQDIDPGEETNRCLKLNNFYDFIPEDHF